MPPLAAALPGILINAAIGVGASVLANVLRPQKSQQTRQQTSSRGLKFEMAVGEATALSAIWGLGRTAGQLTFAQEYDVNNSWMKLKFDCGRGWFSSLDGVIADEKRLTLTGSNANVHGFVAEEYRDASGNPRAWFKFYDGRPGQSADAGLVAAAPTRWGTEHTSTATPYVIVTLNYHADLFPNSSLPRFGFIWKGLRLYDWRKDSTMPGGFGDHRWADQSTWEWTENPAVIAWNFRRGYWRNGVKLFGMGFSQYANDLDYFTACANLADEEMYFEETGATLARYAFGREISDDEEHLAVLRQLEESWCGSSFDRGGAYAPVPAARRTSVLTLTDAHLVEGQPVLADKWGKVSSKKTQIHGTFGSAADLFVPTPFGTRINVALESLTRGPKTDALDQPYEHRIERAQNRAEITLRRHNFGASRKETFSAVANVLEPGDVFTRQCSWGPTLMMVDAIEPNSEGPGRTITAIAWSNSIVPDADEGFIELPADSGVGPAPATRTLMVPGLNVEQFQRITAGNEEPFARASWTATTDPLCDRVIVKVWPDGEDEASTAQYFDASAQLQTALIFGPLKPDTNYRRVGLLSRKDGRQTYPTTEGTFTTGPFVAAVTVADDSIAIAKLVQEVRNRLDVVVGDLPDRILQVEAEVARQAAAGFTQSATDQKHTSLLKARLGRTIAAVIREEAARVEDNAAFAMALTQVQAEIENAFAAGLLSFEVVASEAGVSSKIALMTSIEVEGERGAGGLAIRTYLEGGAIKRDLLVDTDKFIVTDGIHNEKAFIFDGTALRVRNAIIKALTSDNIDVAELVASAAFVEHLTVDWANISSAVIGNFVAGSANIGNLSVDTLKIADGAVNVSLSAQNTNTSLVFGTPQSVSIVFPNFQSGSIMVSGQINIPEVGVSNPGQVQVQLFRNGVLVRSNNVPWRKGVTDFDGYFLGNGYVDSTYIDLPPSPGSYTYQLRLIQNSAVGYGVPFNSMRISGTYAKK